MAKKTPKRIYYKIGEACKLVDIQPYVLRYWETVFPALSPSKSRSGQRVYSEKELDVIRRIKGLLYDEGYTIAGAKKKLEGELAAGGVAKGEDGGGAAVGSGEGGEAAGGEAATPAGEGKRAVDAASEGAAGLDTRAAERIQHMRRGIEAALAQTRSLLELLDTDPGP